MSYFTDLVQNLKISPIPQSPAPSTYTTLSNLYDTQGGVYGKDYSNLRDIIYSGINGQIPDSLTRSIRDESGKLMLDTKQNLAGQGLQGSGLGSVINSDILGKEAAAISDAQFKYRMDSINKLLGLNQDTADRSLDYLKSQQNLTLDREKLAELARQFGLNLDFQKEQADTSFLDVLGSIFGGVAGFIPSLSGGVEAASGGGR